MRRKLVANPFVHIELNTPDPAKAKAFYSKLFGWELEDISNSSVPDGEYTMIKFGKGTGGGIMKQVPHGPLGRLAYVQVENIRIATTKAQSLGGVVMKDVEEVMGMG